MLEDTVRRLADELNPALDVAAAKLCGSAMQGLLVVHDNMTRLDELAGRAPMSRDDLVVRFTRLLVEGFRAG